MVTFVSWNQVLETGLFEYAEYHGFKLILCRTAKKSGMLQVWQRDKMLMV